jgi:glycoside/pentoside/hexuronide:cation symporter, GPH family
MAMMFWVAYTAYTIPYYALCAQLTDDYDERTKIRGMSSMINAGAIFIGAATPSLLGDALVSAGVSIEASWMISAMIVASVAIVFAVITYRSVKGVRLIEDTDESNINIFKSYLDIVRIKPFKFLLVFVLLFMFSNALAQADLIYIINNRLHVSFDVMPVALVSIVVGMAVFTPLTTWLSTKKDRRFAVIIMFSASALGMFAFKFIGITSIPALIVMLLFFSMGTAGFWTTFYSFTYDIAEFDELKNGKRRVGAITSLPQLLQKTGAALGLQTLGAVLAFYGYNAELSEQSLATAIGIENIITLICPALIILSMLVMVMYPVTKAKFEHVKSALEEKKMTGTYDATGLEKLL